MTRHISGLTAEHCAAGLVYAALHFGIHPSKVFETGKPRKAGVSRMAVASAVIAAAPVIPGLTQNIARLFRVTPNKIAPSGLSSSRIDAALQARIVAAMSAAGFDPMAVALVGAAPMPSSTASPRKSRSTLQPARLAVDAIPGDAGVCAKRWLRTFNAGELTLNLVRSRLQNRMARQGLDEALCPTLSELHRAAKALRRADAAEKPPAGAERNETKKEHGGTSAKVAASGNPSPLRTQEGAVVRDDLAHAEVLAKRVSVMRTASARRAERLSFEPEPAPKRIPDIVYGDTQAKPLDLGAGDLALVAACVAQGGFPRAVQVRPGVTVWADHADQIWKFRP